MHFWSFEVDIIRFQILFVRTPLPWPRRRHETMQAWAGRAGGWYQNCTYTIWSSSCNHVALEMTLFDSSSTTMGNGSHNPKPQPQAQKPVLGRKRVISWDFSRKDGAFCGVFEHKRFLSGPNTIKCIHIVVYQPHNTPPAHQTHRFRPKQGPSEPPKVPVSLMQPEKAAS